MTDLIGGPCTPGENTPNCMASILNVTKYCFQVSPMKTLGANWGARIHGMAMDPGLSCEKYENKHDSGIPNLSFSP